MKASELIALLESAIRDYGDKEVTLEAGAMFNYSLVEKVTLHGDKNSFVIK